MGGTFTSPASPKASANKHIAAALAEFIAQNSIADFLAILLEVAAKMKYYLPS
jgi:hypothetical protein